MRVPHRGWFVVLLAVAAVAACNGQTRILVTIDGGDALAFDRYQLRVGDRFATAEPLDVLELVVPDALAGTNARVELWALGGGNQVGYGYADVRPAAHDTIDARVVLGAVACGPWCQPGTASCGRTGAVEGTSECVQAADGCVAPGAVTACASATPYCANGVCSATCVDECSPDTTTCDTSASVRACGQHDDDACLDWSPPMTCAAGNTCANGGCETTSSCNSADACRNRAPECSDATTLRMYGTSGACSPAGECTNSYIDATCPLGCTAGACTLQLAAGGNNTCAIRPTRALACWGSMDNTTLPSAMFTAISVKERHACGTTTAGATRCWPKDTFGNFYGECDVPMGTFVVVSAGDGFSCAVKANRDLACWGDTSAGKLMAPTGAFADVSAGYDHSCAIRTDGTAACWGAGGVGQSSPPGGGFAQVAAGYQFSCGLRQNGAVECWGQIAAPPSGRFIAVSAGFSHACAVRTDGLVACWGDNTNNKATPPVGTTFSAVSAGEQHTCGLRANGTITCWGDASRGATAVPAGL